MIACRLCLLSLCLLFGGWSLHRVSARGTEFYALVNFGSAISAKCHKYFLLI